MRIADEGPVDAVRDLAELISLCAHLRAEGRPGDGEAWAATAATLGGGPQASFIRGIDAERALELHARRVG